MNGTPSLPLTREEINEFAAWHDLCTQANAALDLRGQLVETRHALITEGRKWQQRAEKAEAENSRLKSREAYHVEALRAQVGLTQIARAIPWNDASNFKDAPIRPPRGDAYPSVPLDVRGAYMIQAKQGPQTNETAAPQDDPSFNMQAAGAPAAAPITGITTAPTTSTITLPSTFDTAVARTHTAPALTPSLPLTRNDVTEIVLKLDTFIPKDEWVKRDCLKRIGNQALAAIDLQAENKRICDLHRGLMKLADERAEKAETALTTARKKVLRHDYCGDHNGFSPTCPKCK